MRTVPVIVATWLAALAAGLWLIPHSDDAVGWVMLAAFAAGITTVALRQPEVDQPCIEVGCSLCAEQDAAYAHALLDVVEGAPLAA